MSSPSKPTSRRAGVASADSHLFAPQDATQQQQHAPQLPRRKIRVLCLHGHRTNAKVMINQTKGLRAALGEDLAEFIFLDAPFLAAGPTDPVIEHVHGQDAPFYEWWYGKEAEDVPEDESKWHWSVDTFAETVAFMEEKIEAIGPIDVVVAFSQGSVLLTVLSMLYLQTKDELPWKLCVCVGGVALAGVQFRELFETPDGRPILVPFPSIHIVGRADPLYEKSLQLAEVYDSHTTVFPASPLKKMVVFHDEGHRFPSPRLHKELYEQLARQIVDHCRACDDHSSSRGHALARL